MALPRYTLPPGFGDSLVNELGTSGPTNPPITQQDPVVSRSINSGTSIGQAAPAPSYVAPKEEEPDYAPRPTSAPRTDTSAQSQVAPASPSEVAYTSNVANSGTTGDKLLETINQPTAGIARQQPLPTTGQVPVGEPVPETPVLAAPSRDMGTGPSTITAPAAGAESRPAPAPTGETGSRLAGALDFPKEPAPTQAPADLMTRYVSGYLNTVNPATGMYYTLDEAANALGVSRAELQPLIDYAQQTNLKENLGAGTAQENPLSNINANILSRYREGYNPFAGEEGVPNAQLPASNPLLGGTVAAGTGASGGGIIANPPSAPAPTQYFGPDGKPYSGSGESYWYNAQDKTWYKGSPDGKVTTVGNKAPWDTLPGTGTTPVPGAPETGPSRTGNRLLSLIDAFTTGKANQDLANARSSQLVEQLRGAHTADQQRMAEALLSRGISGGQALASLGGLENAYARGLSGGLSGIQQQMLEEGNQQRAQALESLLQMDTADRKNALEQLSLTINEKLQNREMDISEAQGWQKLINDLMQIDLQNEATQAELGLKGKALDIGTITDLMTLAQSLEGKDQELLLNLLPYLVGESGTVDLGGG